MKISFEIPMSKKEIGQYSLNKIYAGLHWTIRKRQADYIHSLVQTTLYVSKVPKETFLNPVKVTISYNSRLDIDNHSYLSKLIVDGLKGWLIEDDTKKYLINLEQEFWDGDGIKVEIEEKILSKYVKG